MGERSSGSDAHGFDKRDPSSIPAWGGEFLEEGMIQNIFLELAISWVTAQPIRTIHDVLDLKEHLVQDAHVYKTRARWTIKDNLEITIC